MAEIAALPRNGLRVASTFSGCGGSSLGYKMAGYSVVWANEFVPVAQDSYRANAPTTILDCRDIRTIKPKEILEATGLNQGELDIFDGSPPCQSFSTAGIREKGWGKKTAHGDGSTQISDDLFFEYARLLRGVRPRAFVAENVSGLVKGTAKGYFKLILRELRSCGYDVEARVLDAQWLGVPQARQRLIFVGVRLDVGRRPAFPAPLPYRYSLADALDITKHPIAIVRQVIGNDRFEPAFGSIEIPHPTIMAGGCRTSGLVEDDMQPGGDPAIWQADGTARDPETGARIDIGGTAIEREPERFFNVREATSGAPSPTVPLDRPSPTVMAGGIGGSGSSQTVVAHSGRLRKFTLGELRRVCGFPDDFVLTGTYAERWARLGNAVPPPMMAAIAAALRDKVLAPCAE